MIADTVISVIATIKRIPEEQITLESTFEELGIDSLDGTEIVCELEERFRIEISDEVAQELTSVAQVVENLARIVGDQAENSSGVS
jgi:acyl carrier protein